MIKTEMKKNPDEKTKGKKPSPDQDLLDIFVAQGMKMVSQMAPQLKGKASIDVLGNALFEVVNKIETEGAKNGIEFPQWILLRGTEDILRFLLEVAQVQVDEKSVKGIIGIAVGRWLKNAIQTGKMTKEQAVELGRQLQEQSKGQQAGSQRPQSTPAPPQQVAPQMPQGQTGIGG